MRFSFAYIPSALALQAPSDSRGVHWAWLDTWVIPEFFLHVPILNYSGNKSCNKIGFILLSRGVHFFFFYKCHAFFLNGKLKERNAILM